jgi:hypothetical protein
MSQGRERRDKKQKKIEVFENLEDTQIYQSMRQHIIKLLQTNKLTERQAQIILSHFSGKSLKPFDLKEGELNGIQEEVRELLEEQNKKPS